VIIPSIDRILYFINWEL